jgi:hypothetical protein
MCFITPLDINPYPIAVKIETQPQEGGESPMKYDNLPKDLKENPNYKQEN